MPRYYIMATGVKSYHCSSKGAECKLSRKRRVFIPVAWPLHRLAQKRVWHNIKVTNSFHDHQERDMQLSAEVDLPACLSGCLRDIVIFEMLKTYWGHSFNRYAWVILFDVDGAAMDYYAPDTIQLGHAISYVAKQTLFKIHLESNDRNDMADLESDTVKNITSTVKSLATSVEGWEALLEKVESDFMDGRNKKELSQYFTNQVKSASVVKESNELYHDETISERD
ncbi:hypothetical protein HDV63DRAFT_342416 [Trichoderma sp. SZMC 28014]